MQQTKIQIVKALRWLHTKETFGWVSICLGTLFPGRWYRRSKRSDDYWKHFLMPHFERYAKDLRGLWTSILIEKSGRPLPMGGAVDMEDEQFGAWLMDFRSSNHPNEWQGLKTSAFLAARVYTFDSDPTEIEYTSGQSFYQHNFVSEDIKRSLIMSYPNLTWPEIGTQAGILAQKYKLDLSIIHPHLSIDHILDILLPIQFSLVVRSKCKTCRNATWYSEPKLVSYIELARSPKAVSQSECLSDSRTPRSLLFLHRIVLLNSENPAKNAHNQRTSRHGWNATVCRQWFFKFGSIASLISRLSISCPRKSNVSIMVGRSLECCNCLMEVGLVAFSWMDRSSRMGRLKRTLGLRGRFIFARRR
jgi:hypothetical protein